MIRTMSSIICLILLVSKYHLTTGSSVIDIDIFETHNEDSSILIPSIEESASFTNDHQINQIKTIRWEKKTDSRSDTFSSKSHIRAKRMLQEGNEQGMAVLSPTISPQTKKKGDVSSTPKGTRNKEKVPALKGTTTNDYVPTQPPPPKDKKVSSTAKGPTKKGKDSSLPKDPAHKGGNDLPTTTKVPTQKGKDPSFPKDPAHKGGNDFPTTTKVPTQNDNDSYPTKAPAQNGSNDLPSNTNVPTQNDNDSSPTKAPIQNDSNRDDTSLPQAPSGSLIKTNPNTSTTCVDSTMRFKVDFEGNKIARFCAWVARKDTAIRCDIPGINETCPSTCGTCSLCADSPLRLKFVLNDALVARSCEFTARINTEDRCTIAGMADTCRKTCGSCS